MKKFIQFTAALVLLAATVFAISQNNVTAQSTGLRVNPRADLTVRPGDTQTGTLLVANLNKNVSITVDLNVVDFRAQGETGTPTPILEEGVEPTSWSLKPFLTIPSKVELKAGETKYVKYTIRLPKEQGAGSYYSAIKYDPRPAESDDRVIISGAPMQLMFVTVPGKATELLNLRQFGAYNIKEGETNGSYASLFVGSQPQKLAYTLENRGNVAESPAGTIVIKNMFGKQVKTIESANPKKNLALIEQTRRFEVCIEADEREIEQDGRTTTVQSCTDPGFAPGMYKAELNLFYGINGSSTQEINATSVFWYLPWWFLGVVLAILAVLAFIIFKVRQKLIGRTSHRRKPRR